MKKTLATVLTASMLLSVVPAIGAASAAEPETVDGLTMTSYTFKALAPEWPDAYKHIMGQKSMDYQLNYDTNKMYDQTIGDLLDWSKEIGSEKVTGFGNPDDIVKNCKVKDSGNYLENYMIKWSGKITAADAVKITVVGNKIDNGFVMTIDGKRVYEYWGTGYFDKDEDKLPSDLGAVDLTKGEHTVEAWFLEINGGAPLDMGVYIGESTDYKSFADAGLTFDMTATTYHTFVDRWGESNSEEHPWVKAFADAGQKKGNGDDGEGNGGNGGQCVEANQKYDETIQAIMNSNKACGTTIVPRISTFTLSINDESYMNVYEGYITVEKTGFYLFGCDKVDNAFVVDITDGNKTTRAYEFWANGTWNDNTGAWMPNESAVRLEAGKTYGFKATFAEFNGGQALDAKVKYSADGAAFGEATNINTTLKYTTTVPTNNDQVDASVLKGEGVTLLNSKIKQDTVAHDMGDLWGDGPVTNIFDNNPETKFGASNKWEGATITWQTTEPVTVTNYKIVAAADNAENPRIPLGWVLLGSTDGKTYTIIDKVARGNSGIAALNNAEGVYAVDKPAAYSYYKIQVVSNWNGEGQTEDQNVAMSFADLNLYNVSKSTTPPTQGGQTPPPTGSAVIALSTLAVISLAGVVVASKKRNQK